MRVLLVDDVPLFVDAIEPTLRRLGANDVRRATTGEEAIAEVKRREFDVAFVDLGLPDRSGLAVGREILEIRPQVKVVALTGVKDHAVARQALELGFSGYLVKDVSLQEFESALVEVLHGGTVSTLPPPSSRRRTWSLDELTGRELEVLQLLVVGASGRTIAGRLGISHNTVRTHIQSILSKLQVHSRLEAAAHAVQHGLVDVGPPGGQQAGA